MLGSGPRGRGFESRHSDHVTALNTYTIANIYLIPQYAGFFYLGISKCLPGNLKPSYDKIN